MPTVWQQMSYNLSVITACIPTIKTVFDTLSGSNGPVDVPYQPTVTAGTRMQGFQATDLGHNERGSTASLALHRIEVPIFGPDFKNQARCYTAPRAVGSAITDSKDRDDGSESERNLTHGMVMITEEVEVGFESMHESSFCEHLPQVAQT